MNTELSDEQLGRLWCQLNNRAPDHAPYPSYTQRLSPWRWVYDDGPTYAVPLVVWQCLPKFRFGTEAEAYAALGQALRELHRRAGEIAAVLGGVI